MTVAARRPPLLPGLGHAHSLRLVERNLTVYRRAWLVIVSGFAEPLLYLLGIGFGVGALVGDVHLGDRVIAYRAFVAPALMASSAMNGAIYETTFNVFYRLKYQRLYDAVLATPLGVGDIARGEVTWALMRGTAYAVGFIVVMAALHLVGSPWAALAAPAAVLIGFAFAAVGIAVTTWVRAWQDFDLVQLVMLPLFLFSATFYPLTRYPAVLQAVVQVTPLYRGVHLLRALTTGDVDLTLLADVAYLVAMGLVGVAVASRRLGLLLLR